MEEDEQSEKLVAHGYPKQVVHGLTRHVLVVPITTRRNWTRWTRLSSIHSAPARTTVLP